MKKVCYGLILIAFLLFLAAASSSDMETLPFELIVVMSVTGLLLLGISLLILRLQKKAPRIKLSSPNRKRSRPDAA